MADFEHDKSRIIGIDFDGTIVRHEYPQIGATIFMALETIKELIENGHRIILYTMRSGKELEAALKFIRGQGIHLYGINENPSQKEWTDSPKVYCHIYIDDANLGVPLVRMKSIRSWVDWELVREHLMLDGLIKFKE